MRPSAQGEAPVSRNNMNLLSHNEGATHGSRHEDRRVRSPVEQGQAARPETPLKLQAYLGARPRRNNLIGSCCCCRQGTGVASGWPFSANIQLRTFAASDELAFVAL